MRALRNASADDRPALIRTELVPYLADVLNLPPGMTASALADHLENQSPTLADVLRQADHQGFTPGGGVDISTERLIKAITRLAIWLILAVPVSLVAAPEPPTPAASTDTTAIFAQATTAYDREHTRKRLICTTA